MNKFILFACLCVCTFAKRVFYPPEYLECPYHAIVSSPYDGESGEYFGAILGSAKYAKVLHSDSSYILYRCDNRSQDGRCYVKYFDANSETPCAEGYEDPGDVHFYGAMPFDQSGFEYDDWNYPQPTACPDPSETGCEKYCTDDTEASCVVVNSKGFYLKSPEGLNYTFYDPPSMDVFVDTKCDGQTTLDTPENFCGAIEELPYFDYFTTYHIGVESISSHQKTDYYAVYLEEGRGTVLYFFKRVKERETILYREDLGEYVKTVTPSGCSESKGSSYLYVPMLYFYNLLYDSAHYPKTVKCPDNSSECLLYCEDTYEFECFTTDAIGRVVRSDSYIYTYYDRPTMDVFEDVKCDESTPVPAPPDYYAVMGKFTPKLPDCSFHIKVEYDIETWDFYGIANLSTFEVVSFKAQQGDDYKLYRCDVDDGKGHCYYKTCEKSNCSDGYEDPLDEMVWEYDSLLPRPIYYNNSEYPVDVQCPDGTDGCKSYCNILFTFNCYIINPDGYLVQDVGGVNLTYSEVSMDEFETDTCSTPSTHIPAPNTDVCRGGDQSSSTPVTPSSSTPSPSHVSPSAPVLSSASIVNVAFTFVAVTLVVALF